MRKLLVPALAVMMTVGSVIPPVAAAPIAAPASIAPRETDVVKVLICGPGRHLGPLGRCRADGAVPIFSYRKPCPPTFHRNFVGLCRPNRR